MILRPHFEQAYSSLCKELGGDCEELVLLMEEPGGAGSSAQHGMRANEDGALGVLARPDAYVLWSEVQRLGGYRKVCADKLWPQVLQTLCDRPPGCSTTLDLRSAYEALQLVELDRRLGTEAASQPAGAPAAASTIAPAAGPAATSTAATAAAAAAAPPTERAAGLADTPAAPTIAAIPLSKEEFTSSYDAFCTARNIKAKESRVFNGISISMYDLWSAVHSRGGFDQVSAKQEWGLVVRSLLPADVTWGPKGNQISTQLKQGYRGNMHMLEFEGMVSQQLQQQQQQAQHQQQQQQQSQQQQQEQQQHSQQSQQLQQPQQQRRPQQQRWPQQQPHPVPIKVEEHEQPPEQQRQAQPPYPGPANLEEAASDTVQPQWAEEVEGGGLTARRRRVQPEQQAGSSLATSLPEPQHQPQHQHQHQHQQEAHAPQRQQPLGRQAADLASVRSSAAEERGREAPGPSGWVVPVPVAAVGGGLGGVQPVKEEDSVREKGVPEELTARWQQAEELSSAGRGAPAALAAPAVPTHSLQLLPQSSSSPAVGGWWHPLEQRSAEIAVSSSSLPPGPMPPVPSTSAPSVINQSHTSNDAVAVPQEDVRPTHSATPSFSGAATHSMQAAAPPASSALSCWPPYWQGLPGTEAAMAAQWQQQQPYAQLLPGYQVAPGYVMHNGAVVPCPLPVMHPMAWQQQQQCQYQQYPQQYPQQCPPYPSSYMHPGMAMQQQPHMAPYPAGPQQQQQMAYPWGGPHMPPESQPQAEPPQMLPTQPPAQAPPPPESAPQLHPEQVLLPPQTSGRAPQPPPSSHSVPPPPQPSQPAPQPQQRAAPTPAPAAPHMQGHAASNSKTSSLPRAASQPAAVRPPVRLPPSAVSGDPQPSSGAPSASGPPPGSTFSVLSTCPQQLPALQPGEGRLCGCITVHPMLWTRFLVLNSKWRARNFPEGAPSLITQEEECVEVLDAGQQPPESRAVAEAIQQQQADCPVSFTDAIKQLVACDTNLLDEDASIVGQDEEGQKRAASNGRRRIAVLGGCTLGEGRQPTGVAGKCGTAAVALSFHWGVGTSISLLGGYLMPKDDFNGALMERGWQQCPAWQQQHQQHQQHQQQQEGGEGTASGSAAAWRVEVHRYSQELPVTLPADDRMADVDACADGEQDEEEDEGEAQPTVLSGLGYGNAAQLVGEAWAQPEELVKAFDRRHRLDPEAIHDPLRWPKPKEQQGPNCAVVMISVQGVPLPFLVTTVDKIDKHTVLTRHHGLPWWKRHYSLLQQQQQQQQQGRGGQAQQQEQEQRQGQTQGQTQRQAQGQQQEQTKGQERQQQQEKRALELGSQLTEQRGQQQEDGQDGMRGCNKKPRHEPIGPAEQDEGQALPPVGRPTSVPSSVPSGSKGPEAAAEGQQGERQQQAMRPSAAHVQQWQAPLAPQFTEPARTSTAQLPQEPLPAEAASASEPSASGLGPAAAQPPPSLRIPPVSRDPRLALGPSAPGFGPTAAQPPPSLRIPPASRDPRLAFWGSGSAGGAGGAGGPQEPASPEPRQESPCKGGGAGACVTSRDQGLAGASASAGAAAKGGERERQREAPGDRTVDAGLSHSPDRGGSGPAAAAARADRAEKERLARTLFAFNLPQEAKEEDVKVFFSRAGIVCNVEFSTDTALDRPTDVAYVELRTAKEACSAVTRLNGQLLLGQPVQAAIKPHDGDICVQVSNLPATPKGWELRNAFGSFGDIVAMRTLPDGRAGTCAAVLKFRTFASGVWAMQHWHGRRWPTDGRKVEVSQYVEAQQASPASQPPVGR